MSAPTLESIKAAFESVAAYPFGSDQATVLRFYASKCAKAQAELMCLPQSACTQAYFNFQRLVQQDLADYESDAKRLGIDLWEGHIIDG